MKYSEDLENDEAYSKKVDDFLEKLDILIDGVDKEITKLNWMIVKYLFFIGLILSPIIILLLKILK